jgi:hypothetical protein
MALEGPQVADQLPQIPQTLLALLRTPNTEEVAG